MNTLEVPGALDGIAPIGVSGQRQNVEQGGICHCLHSLTIWASNLDKVSQHSRADRTVPSESGAGLEQNTRKGKLPFSGKEPVAVTGTGGRDDQRRQVPAHRHSTQQEPQGNCLWSQACSHSPSRCCGTVCIPQPPCLPRCKHLSGKKACRDKRLGAGRGHTAIHSHGPHL